MQTLELCPFRCAESAFCSVGHYSACRRAEAGKALCWFELCYKQGCYRSVVIVELRHSCCDERDNRQVDLALALCAPSARRNSVPVYIAGTLSGEKPTR